MWEDDFYISPPHVLKPLKTGALVEVVPDNIIIVTYQMVGVSSKSILTVTDTSKKL